MGIRTINVSHFFNREMLLYSFGEFRLKNAVPLKQAAITLAFAGLNVWLMFQLGIFEFEFWRLFIALGIPYLIGKYAPKPIWNGRTLFNFLVVNAKFLIGNKVYRDLKGEKGGEVRVYETNSSIWVSRREQYQKLAKLKKEKESL